MPSAASKAVDNHAAKLRPEPRTVEIDGEAVPFNLSINKACEIEEKLGMAWMTILEGLGEAPSLRVMRTIFAMALSAGDRQISEIHAGEILGRIGHAAAMEIFQTANVNIVKGVAGFTEGLHRGLAGKKA